MKFHCLPINGLKFNKFTLIWVSDKILNIEICMINGGVTLVL